VKGLVLLCLVASPLLASAEAPPDIARLLPPDGDPSGAIFAFAGNAVHTNATSQEMTGDLPGLHTVKNVVGAYSKDKKAYWASAELVSGLIGASKAVDGHASALWERGDSGWKLVAFSLVPTANNKQHAESVKAGLAPPEVPDANNASGEYFMTIFSGAFGEDAKGLVSTRKDATMFGSGQTERYVGGAKMAKAFGAWNLSFAVRDGITSGTTKGRLLWIAANLDARRASRPKAPATPYRVFLIFEGDGSGSYSLVHASFAEMVVKPWP